MGELVPGRAASILLADEESVDELLDHPIGQTSGTVRLADHLPSQAIVGEELALAPLADTPLADSGTQADLLDPPGIIAGQDGIDAPLGAAGVLLVEPIEAGLAGEPIPVVEADDLEVHRLDVPAGDRHGLAVRALNVGGAEVGDEIVREIGRDGYAPRLEGFLEGLTGGIDVEQVEAETAREPAGDEIEVRLECGHVFLAHREQRPEAAVLLQQTAELDEEFLLRVLVGGVGRQDLLELVEDEDQPGRPVAVPLTEGIGPELERGLQRIEVAESGGRMCARRVRIPGPIGPRALQRGERGPDEPIRRPALRPFPGRGKRLLDSDDRQVVEPLVAQARDLVAQAGDEAGLDQRRLAGTRGGEEEHDPLGDQEIAEPLDVAVATEEVLAMPEGARADEGTGPRVGRGRGDGGGHGRPPLGGC